MCGCMWSDICMFKRQAICWVRQFVEAPPFESVVSEDKTDEPQNLWVVPGGAGVAIWKWQLHLERRRGGGGTGDSMRTCRAPAALVWQPSNRFLRCADEKKPSMIQNLKTEVLTNPYVWLFAISYFFVYVIRQGATSWLIFYLKVTTASMHLPPLATVPLN